MTVRAYLRLGLEAGHVAPGDAKDKLASVAEHNEERLTGRVNFRYRQLGAAGLLASAGTK